MKKGEKTKQKLLMIAYELFLSKGYEETSVEDILNIAQIAKGTFYYYFQSKEQILEQVIDMMIGHEAEAADKIALSPLPPPEKIVGIIASFRPGQEEQPIGEIINRPENLIMHRRTQQKLMEKITPLLCGIVEEGLRSGVFECDHIPERVKILLILGSALFDDSEAKPADVEVFIDLAEKLFGAEKGSMRFIRTLIQSPPQN